MFNLIVIVLSISLLFYAIISYHKLNNICFECREDAIIINGLIIVATLSYSFLSFRWLAQEYRANIATIDDIAWNINEITNMIIFFLVLKASRKIRKDG